MNSDERKLFEDRMIGTQDFTDYTPPKKKKTQSDQIDEDNYQEKGKI